MPWPYNETCKLANILVVFLHSYFQASPSKRLSERFLNRIGGRLTDSDVRERERNRPIQRDPNYRFDSRRLGRLPFRGHDSGDSLERDTGEDLRAELDGKHAANMLIQITRSPNREEVRYFQAILIFSFNDETIAFQKL